MKSSSSLGVFFLAAMLIVTSGLPPTVMASQTAPFSPAQWEDLVGKAKKEGTVVIYAGPIGEARNALTEAFRQKYGISLDIVLGRGKEIVARIESERRAGIYSVDVGIHGMTTFFNSIKPKSITVPIAPLLILPEILDLAKWRGGKLPLADQEGHLAVLVLGSSPHLLINTTMVKPDEIKSHRDLLDPKWQGKLAMNDPSLGGAGTEWFTFIVKKEMGLEKGTAFMKQLARQKPAVTRDQRLLSEWVARGKYAAVLAPDKSTTMQLIRAGAPLAFVDLEESRPTSSGPGNIMVFDRAPHPNATKLFLNWILSKEGIGVYSRAHGYTSTRLDVVTEGVDPIFMPRPTDTILGEDYQIAKGEMRKLAKEIFRDVLK
ncbi:MAG: extracellular solute-binding protein [Desulfobacterales bacterium]|nr:extracellular solute-binding protein [Desulfobacterales bacterium]